MPGDPATEDSVAGEPATEAPATEEPVTEEPATGDPVSGSPSSEPRVAVGLISGTWGLRGHVKIRPLTSNPDRFRRGELLLVRGEPTRILDVTTPKGYPCVQFEGCSDRADAQSLAGVLVELAEEDLPELPDDEYYIHDLEGLQVVTTEGLDLGRLIEVLRTGANDVYVVRRRGRKQDVLIPAIADVVREVNLKSRLMVVEPLPGLLDL